jgi:hypothetical protein
MRYDMTVNGILGGGMHNVCSIRTDATTGMKSNFWKTSEPTTSVKTFQQLNAKREAR